MNKSAAPQLPSFTRDAIDLEDIVTESSNQSDGARRPSLNYVELIYLFISMFHAISFIRLLASIWRSEIPPGVQTGEAAILVLATIVFAYDNLIIATGRKLGNGKLLELLSRLRYFAYALITPWLLFLLGSIHCHEQSELVTSFCSDAESGFAIPVSICLFVLTVVREFMGSTLTLSPNDVGACLASESFLSKVYFVPDSKESMTLIYRPVKARNGFGAAFSISVIYSLYRGMHDEFQTSPAPTMSHRWLLVGGILMVASSVCVKLVIGGEPTIRIGGNTKSNTEVNTHSSTGLEPPDRKIVVFGWKVRDKLVKNLSQRFGEMCWISCLVSFFLAP